MRFYYQFQCPIPIESLNRNKRCKLDISEDSGEYQNDHDLQLENGVLIQKIFHDYDFFHIIICSWKNADFNLKSNAAVVSIFIALGLAYQGKKNFHSLSKILSRFNHLICRDYSRYLFVTMFPNLRKKFQI